MRRTQTGHELDPILFNSGVMGLHSSETFSDSLFGSPKKPQNPKLSLHQSQTLDDIKNSERQSFWFQKSLANRHSFPGLQSLDPEIQELLSIPTSQWVPLTTTQSIHILGATRGPHTYIKTSNLIKDQFHKIGTLLTNDHSMQYWNPYLKFFETFQYTKDSYGVYDCQYEISNGNRKFLISDKWLSLLWWHPKYFLVLKYSL
jgi:hypothetical protein